MTAWNFLVDVLVHCYYIKSKIQFTSSELNAIVIALFSLLVSFTPPAHASSKDV